MVVKIKSNKDFLARHNNPNFSYKFKKGQEYEIPDEHWELLQKFKHYLTEVKESRVTRRVSG